MTTLRNKWRALWHGRGALILIFLGLLVFANAPGCICVDTDPDVSPPCPGGVQAAATVTINADLSGIRPLGSPKQIRVRGNRNDSDLCFAVGAEVSFIEILEGETTATVTKSNLAHGTWEFEITAFSGGNQNPINLNQGLTPGATHTLTISSNAAGDMTASF